MSEENSQPPNSSPDDLIDDDRTRGQRVIEARITGSLYRGPLPDPETLERYRQISPEILSSIITAFNSQGAHRKSIESWIFKGGTIRSILGVLFAFLIGMTAIICGTVLVLYNHPVAGTIFGGFGIAGIIKSFLDGTRVFGKVEEEESLVPRDSDHDHS